MKRLLIPALLTALTLTGCMRSGPGNPGTAEVTTVPELPDYAIGRPILSGNLAVIPVICKHPIDRGDDDYATLAEAQKHGWLDIMEMPYGEVGRLRVRNTGPKPVLLLGGELLVGGKQDRVVVKDVVIQPGRVEEIAVNCVEHDRWTGTTDHFKFGDTMVPLGIRDEAAYGDQVGVWRRVGQFNDEAKADASKSTVRGGLESVDVRKRIDDDLGNLSRQILANKDVVGLIIAVGGKPRTLEIFGTPELYAASQEAILKSALAEVALSGGGSAEAPSTDECAAFLSSCMNSRRRLRSDQGGMNNFSTDAPGVQGGEIGGRDYEGKASSAAKSLVHGTYTRSGDR